MDTNKKQKYLTVSLVLLTVLVIIFVRQINVKSNQEALSLNSGVTEDASRSGGGTFVKCAQTVPAVTVDLSMDPTNPAPTTMVRGQQDFKIFVMSAKTGVCPMKLNQLIVEHTGTATTTDIERAELTVEYSGGSFDFSAPLVIGPIFKTFTFDLASHANVILPANAGQPGSGVPAVKLRVSVSMSPGIPSNISRTVGLRVLSSSWFSVVNPANSTPMTVIGTFPLGSNLFQVKSGLGAPSISTAFASNITNNSATLNTTIQGGAFGSGTDAFFWRSVPGQNILLGQALVLPFVPLNPSTINIVANNATGLSSATNYEYRPCIRKITGQYAGPGNAYIVCGAVQTFITQ